MTLGDFRNKSSEKKNKTTTDDLDGFHSNIINETMFIGCTDNDRLRSYFN